MNDESGNLSASGKPQDGGGGNRGTPAVVILVNLTVLALVCVGGYFFLMKLIEVSRQEDCLISGRRNCAPITVPFDR